MVQIDRRAGKVTLALSEYRLLLGLLGLLAVVCFGSGLALGAALRPAEQGALAEVSLPAEVGSSPMQTLATRADTARGESDLMESAPGDSAQSKLDGAVSDNGSATERFGVRVGIFSAPENAAAMERRILAGGYIPAVVVHYEGGSALRYVYVGMTTTLEAANALADVIEADMGLEAWIDRLPPDDSKQ